MIRTHSPTTPEAQSNRTTASTEQMQSPSRMTCWPQPPWIPRDPHSRALRLRLLAVAVLAGVAAALPACGSGKADVSVTLQPNQYWGTLVYAIQAETDEVVISDVVVNRGNCKVPPGTAAELERKVTLKFGQTWRGFSPDCRVGDVKEVVVTTGRGSFAFSF